MDNSNHSLISWKDSISSGAHRFAQLNLSCYGFVSCSSFFSSFFLPFFLRTTGPARTRALQRTPTRRKRRETNAWNSCSFCDVAIVCILANNCKKLQEKMQNNATNCKTNAHIAFFWKTCKKCKLLQNNMKILQKLQKKCKKLQKKCKKLQEITRNIAE